MFETFTDQFLLDLDKFAEFLPTLIFAIVVLLIFYFAGKGIGIGIKRAIEKSGRKDSSFLYFSKLVNGIIVFIGFIFFLNILGFQAFATTLLAGGGLTAVILGFAFKDIGENFLAGFLLAFSRPFNKGDLIETGGITGRVQVIELRHTHVRTSDGCDVFIPSAQLFTKPLHNYTIDGLRRGSFTVGIDYGDDPQKAITLLSDTVRSVKKVLKKPAPSVQIKGFDPNYVELQVSFWINVRDQEAGLPAIRTDVMNNCRHALIDNNFTFSADVSTAVQLSPVEVAMQK